MKKTLLAIVIVLAFTAGCIDNAEVININYHDHGLHYNGTVIEDGKDTTVNITIDGKLDNYPLTGTVIGPADNATVTYEVRAMLLDVMEIPDNFMSTTYHDITNMTSMEIIDPTLLTAKVVTEINCTIAASEDGSTGEYKMSGTLTQIYGEEPYYNMSMAGADESGMMSYTTDMIGPETNLSIAAEVVSAMGSMKLAGFRDLTVPTEEVNMTFVSGTGIFAGGEVGEEVPGFEILTAIGAMFSALIVLRRRGSV